MVVIAAIEESEQNAAIVREAAELADKFGDELHVVHVISKTEYKELIEGRAQQWDSLKSEDVQDIADSVAEDAVSGVSREYRVVSLVGNEADEIVAYADEHDARYIVIGGRRRSPTGKALFGSVSQSVLLQSEHPVVLLLRN